MGLSWVSLTSAHGQPSQEGSSQPSRLVGLITGLQRKMFFLTGITIAGKKHSVIRDNLLVDEDNVMDIRSKGSDSRSICIGKNPKALTFLMVKKGVHGGALSQKSWFLRPFSFYM
ncbi:unnamed protein product [Bubo scandiacus]